MALVRSAFVNSFISKSESSEEKRNTKQTRKQKVNVQMAPSWLPRRLALFQQDFMVWMLEERGSGRQGDQEGRRGERGKEIERGQKEGERERIEGGER